MPGAYAHFALINKVHSRFADSFSSIVQDSLDIYLQFCDLGAVSPDYPYLSPLGGNAREWADAMHYHQTVQFVRNGVEIIRALEDGEEKQKSIAWLLGYASHVIADCVIHPIVNWIVMGEYSNNPTEHRVCEMHQDAYIFNKVMGVDVNAAEYLDSSIAFCTVDGEHLAPIIKLVWEDIFRKTHHDLYKIAPPQLDNWHNNYLIMLDNIQELIGYIPFSRHVQSLSSFTYPELREIEGTYIEVLETPSRQLTYDEVFDFAVDKVVERWKEIDQAIQGEIETCMLDVGEPSLDNGTDKESGRCVFWG